MIRKIIFPMHFILTFYASDAFAAIYDYSVTGHFQVDNIDQYVSGNMQISDDFLVREMNGFDTMYYFEITNFSLNVTGGTSYDFTGEGSLAWIHQITDPQTGQKIYEEQWGISNAVSGDFWTQPYSPCIDFFTSEMIPYKPTSNEYYGILAPTIALLGPSVASQYDSYYSMGGGPIWLTRNSAPVPEPSTMVLLGTGLLVPFIARKRGNKSTGGI